MFAKTVSSLGSAKSGPERKEKESSIVGFAKNSPIVTLREVIDESQ
jgi:hypothetical protein